MTQSASANTLSNPRGPGEPSSRIKLSRELMQRLTAALNGPTSGRNSAPKGTNSSSSKMVPPTPTTPHSHLNHQVRSMNSERRPEVASSSQLAAPGSVTCGRPLGASRRQAPGQTLRAPPTTATMMMMMMNNSCSSNGTNTCSSSSSSRPSSTESATSHRQAQAKATEAHVDRGVASTKSSGGHRRSQKARKPTGARHKNSLAQKLPLVVAAAAAVVVDVVDVGVAGGEVAVAVSVVVPQSGCSNQLEATAATPPSARARSRRQQRRRSTGGDRMRTRRRPGPSEMLFGLTPAIGKQWMVSRRRMLLGERRRRAALAGTRTTEGGPGRGQGRKRRRTSPAKAGREGGSQERDRCRDGRSSSIQSKLLYNNKKKQEDEARSNDSKKSSVIQPEQQARPKLRQQNDSVGARVRRRRRRCRKEEAEQSNGSAEAEDAAEAGRAGAASASQHGAARRRQRKLANIGKRRQEATEAPVADTCETTKCDSLDEAAATCRPRRHRRSVAKCWSKPSVPPTRSGLMWPLLLLALWLFLGSGGGGHGLGAPMVPVSGLQLESGGAGSSEDLKSAVLATMSTRSPPAGRPQAPAEFGEPTADPFAGLQATNATPSEPKPAPEAEAEPMDLLERLLQCCRIFIMGAIIVAAICGNSLVILSVCRHSKLRVTTNWFVVSLACADILVALFAMTFNASVIASGRWLFKPWVCDFWNSCDVLASTASILHLCCISIDRYIAIVHPLDYPMKITTRRVIYALCGVWISSALLSYIPIFTGIYTTAEHINWLKENPDQCEFVVNRVYAIVSSSISFWVPCCIMVFTYYRIYREASRQEKFIYKTQSMMPAPMANHHHHHSNHQGGGGGNHYSKSHNRAKQRRSKSVAVPGGGGGGGNSRAAAAVAAANRQHHLKPANSGAAIATTDLNSSSSVQALGAVGGGGSEKQLPTDTSVSGCKQPEAGANQADPAEARAASLMQLGAGESEPLAGAAAAESTRNSSQQRIVVAFDQEQEGKRLAAVAAEEAAAAAAAAAAATADEEDEEEESNSGQSTPTKRSISKMKREHKAAKTLGIIMGVFIICWLPFFTWYTPQHICGHACDGIVPRGAVTILFWIGYFNSTLNPIIYAYFNSEFRDAFKKTLQWIFCCCQDLKCLRVNRPNDNQHYNCTYRSTQEIGLVSNS